jgi:diaminohydroxyphosphoribosylaminopyrimidine deaminase/5-amino-6-(5-phosphoribosylamino)uracil reductase
MAQAIRLARQGIYSTHPNPNVGCVIVAQGNVVGCGWHRQAGGAHAEIHALREAGEKACNADVYLTLEPCSHHGRTPPCAEALVDAGVRRVVVAMQDPNPLVAGQGLGRLRQAGIAVETGLMETQARATAAPQWRRVRVNGLAVTQRAGMYSVYGRAVRRL